MASQGGSGGDGGFTSMLLLAAAAIGIYLAVLNFAEYVLIPWKWLRSAEMMLIFHFPAALEVAGYPWAAYDHNFHKVNDLVWSFYRFAGLPMIVIAYATLLRNGGAWSMEHYIDIVYKRFGWLSLISTVREKDSIFSFEKPFVHLNVRVKYNDIKFREGADPIQFFEENEKNLLEVLKKQLGPRLVLKNGKIEWKDRHAKKVAEKCLSMIPDKAPLKGAPSWRKTAWQRCLRSHRFERTFAIGMLQEARNFGVVGWSNFLYLRAIASGKTDDPESAFVLWRAIVSLGGKTYFPEAAGIMSHYLYEKSLNVHLRRNPQDAEIVYGMRGDPSLQNAVEGFTGMKETIFDINKR